MNKNFKSRCYITESFGVNSEKNIYLNSIYIECNYMLIQVSIVYERSNFYWIGKDNFQTSRTKYFGDTPRSLNRFKLIRLIDDDSNIFFAPSNLNAFILEYKYSKFLECDKKLATENYEKLGSLSKLHIDLKKSEEASKILEYISNYLSSSDKIFWLDSMTLLSINYLNIFFFK